MNSDGNNSLKETGKTATVTNTSQTNVSNLTNLRHETSSTFWNEIGNVTELFKELQRNKKDRRTTWRLK
jgi:hypothetical protein